jgi:hypothetical protein
VSVVVRERDGTYGEDGRIIGHLRLWWAVLFRRCENSQVFDVASAEDDAIVDGVRAWDLLGRIALATFGAMTLHILQRNGGGLGVDGFEGADVSEEEC